MSRKKHVDGQLEAAVDGYLNAALWSSTGANDEPLDSHFDPSDFAPSAQRQAERELIEFLMRAAEAVAILDDRAEEHGTPPPPRLKDGEQIGHDFWLTRNGHGVGFWDRPQIYGEELAEILSDISREAGERDVYEGDDGKIYFSPDPGALRLLPGQYLNGFAGRTDHGLDRDAFGTILRSYGFNEYQAAGGWYSFRYPSMTRNMATLRNPGEMFIDVKFYEKTSEAHIWIGSSLRKSFLVDQRTVDSDTTARDIAQNALVEFDHVLETSFTPS